jgi:hypothetical protein
MSQPAHKRKQRGPRAPKKEARSAAASNASAPPAPAPAPAPKLSPRAAAFRARRGVPASQASTFTLSREQEMMYIREDLRRLVYISGGLLVLMFVILYILER